MAQFFGVFHLAVFVEALGQPAVVAALPGLQSSAVVAQHLERAAGVADFGGAAVELAGLFDLFDLAAAHLVGPPPGEHSQNQHGHQNDGQHRPGDDAHHHQGDQRHRQIEHRRGHAARHAAAQRAYIAEQLQPLAGRALLQAQHGVAQHAVHQRLRHVAVDGGAGFAQGTGAAAAQPQLQTQKAQHAGYHGDQGGIAAAGDDAVVNLEQKDRRQQAQQTDGQRQPGSLAQIGAGALKTVADGAGKRSCRSRNTCGAGSFGSRNQLVREQEFNHGQDSGKGPVTRQDREAC